MTQQHIPDRPPLEGWERRILRHLPTWLLWGSVIFILPSLVMRVVVMLTGVVEGYRLVMTADITSVSFLILHWTVMFTVAIAAWIVKIMKGPVLVADAYPLPEQRSAH